MVNFRTSPTIQHSGFLAKVVCFLQELSPRKCDIMLPSAHVQEGYTNLCASVADPEVWQGGFTVVLPARAAKNSATTPPFPV